MDQVYFVSKPLADGRRPVLYRYGNFCYSDSLRVEGCDDLRKLPRVMQYLQSVQGEMPFFSEYASIPTTSPHATSLSSLEEVVEFILEEMTGAGGALEDLATSGEKWLDADGVNVYFELETMPGFTCNTADVIFCKTFRQDVILTVIYHDTTFFATLADASEEQALVDTVFPNIYGRQRGMHLRSYDHPKFKKLSVWEASAADSFPEGSTSESAETFESVAAIDSAALDEDVGVENLSGDGYTQTYIVRRPQHLREGSYRRDVLFRFGNWCYEGQVDFGVDALHLGDVPEVLPALQKQQGNLAFLCETSSVPASNQFCSILRTFAAGVNFFQTEMVAAEAELERLTELGETAWINEDWAASFFEMQFHPSEALRQVEVIASKCYFRGGVILHTVMYGGSIYAVLADASDDQPLLDVAFPDVTARCRGVQLRSYDPTDKAEGSSLRPRRLLVWEGRRKGSSGVGWGTGSIVTGDVGAEIRAAAARKAEREADKTAAEVAAMADKPAARFATTGASSSAAGGKDAEDDASDGKGADDDVDEGKAADAAEGDSKVAESGSGAGSGSGGGGSSAGGGGSGSGGLSDVGVRAPHHLPPMGGLGGRLKPVGSLSGPSPWDSTGRPVLGKK